MRLKMILALVGLALLVWTPITQADTTTDTATIASDSIAQSPVPQVGRSLVYAITIEGAIGAVTAERIAEAIELSEDEDAELLIIILDTPGGFTNSTWVISKSILNGHVPVCVYIAPLGATAGSAGRRSPTPSTCRASRPPRCPAA